MLTDNSIEDIVRKHVPFIHGSGNGWNRVYCAVCGDGSRTKGPRGGWFFDVDVCFYHCFNCGVDGSFDPHREYACSKNMRDIFEKFNVPKTEYSDIIYSKKLNKENNNKIEKKENIIKTLDIPNHFYKLSEAKVDNVIAINAKEYLISRNVEPDSYPFFLSTGISDSANPKEVIAAKLLRNRIIIPSFKGPSMVYYQARSLDVDSKIPYINADTPKGNIIYGFDKLFINQNAPLFITEGFFDAYHLQGVAVLENSMTTAQIDIIERSPRPKVVVPDSKGDSKKLAEQAINQGWGISIPEIGNCKDIDEAIKKYGKLYVLDSVMKTIKNNRIAKGFLQFV